MKTKTLIIIIAIVLLLGLLIFLQSKSSNSSPNGENSTLASACAESGGTYLAEFNECENIWPDQCTALGGIPNECASACRHDPSAEFCTLQCVQVCEFE